MTMAFLQRGITLKTLLENPDLLNPPNVSENEKKDVFAAKDPDSSPVSRPNQSAFLGPQLWDKTLPYDLMGDFKDFKLEYMDLDEFFNENSNELSNDLNKLAEDTRLSGNSDLELSELTAQASPQLPAQASPPQAEPRLLENLLIAAPSGPSLLTTDTSHLSPHATTASTANVLPHSGHNTVGVSKIHKTRSAPSPKQRWSPTTTRSELAEEIDVEPAEIMLASVPDGEAVWQEGFDPKKRQFSVEELRPQPVIKKSKKVFVPDSLKDDKYWNRRNKNNVAAKRSRDARRIKENQIALRAAFLERENEKLVSELAKMKEENVGLRTRLSKYEKV